jgi:hypothetical protein
MVEKITLDMLTQDSVSVKKQNYIEVNDELQPVGQPWRRAYINSAQGRQQVQAEVPSPQKEVIFAVWGDIPTVDETAQ